MSRLRVCGTTAQLPGIRITDAVARIAAGIEEPLFGRVDLAHVQLCPQNPGRLDEATCEALAAAYPDTRLRTHANARVDVGLLIRDLSTVDDDTLPFFRLLADRNRRFGAEAISLHAGYQDQASLDGMLDNLQRLQDEVLGDIAVAVEGLYPSKRRDQLVSTWADYETLLAKGVPLAIDLSHLKIVAHYDGGWQQNLVEALLSSPQLREVHLSDNDGRADQHSVCSAPPWWWPVLNAISLPAHAVVFTEGNALGQLRGRSI
jgi:hypothetical protein